jgi:hypothetical protein
MISYACESHTGLHLCGADFKTAANRHHGLQQEVLHSLPADQDILHVKSLADWEDILKSPRNNTITVDADNIMVAQSLAIHPTLTDQASAADMLDMELPGEPHTLSTFCAVMTHPAHRGRHLMQRMMDEWKFVAKQDGRQHLLGCITRSNVPSWSQFLQAGLVITGAGFDPSDDSTVYYAHCDINDPVKFDMRDTITVTDTHPMSELKSKLKDGYVGVAGEKQGNQYTRGLVMARRL